MCNAPTQPGISRHFTTTGYVIHGDRALLHWHQKVRAWLPPGGHVELNEDPVTAVLREIREETGLSAEVISRGLPIDVEYPLQIPAPETILVEDIDDPQAGPHQHVDLIYFCRPLGSVDNLKEGWRWVDQDSLIRGEPIIRTDGSGVPPPRDVRQLALAALQKARDPST